MQGGERAFARFRVATVFQNHLQGGELGVGQLHISEMFPNHLRGGELNVLHRRDTKVFKNHRLGGGRLGLLLVSSAAFQNHLHGGEPHHSPHRFQFFFLTTYTMVNGAAQRSDPKVHFQTTRRVVNILVGTCSQDPDFKTNCSVVNGERQGCLRS